MAVFLAVGMVLGLTAGCGRKDKAYIIEQSRETVKEEACILIPQLPRETRCGREASCIPCRWPLMSLNIRILISGYPTILHSYELAGKKL